MQLEEKKKFTKELKEDIKNHENMIVAGYQGLDVNSINELRSRLKKHGCRMKVVKNRLAKRSIDSLKNKGYEDLKDYFSGPTSVLLGDGDQSESIKIFKEYAKENEYMKFKGGIINENIFTGEQVEKIAELPSKEELIAQTAIALNSPIQNLQYTFSGIIKRLMYALNSMKEKKESGELSSPGENIKDKGAGAEKGKDAAAEKGEASVKDKDAEKGKDAAAEKGEASVKDKNTEKDAGAEKGKDNLKDKGAGAGKGEDKVKDKNAEKDKGAGAEKGKDNLKDKGAAAGKGEASVKDKDTEKDEGAEKNKGNKGTDKNKEGKGKKSENKVKREKKEGKSDKKVKNKESIEGKKQEGEDGGPEKK